MLRTEPIAIDWNPSLPVFASERFLRSTGAEYGWLGGRDGERIRCVLPYTIIRKGILRMVRFRTATIALEPITIAEETSFLNGAMAHFRSQGVDLVMPATANAVFRTFPTGSEAVPYGSYVIDLTLPEETLWKNVDRITRQNIKSAAAAGIQVREAAGAEAGRAYAFIEATFRRSRLPFMGLKEFCRYLDGLGEYGKLMVADFKGEPQSYVVFGYSQPGAYAIYAGNADNQRKGANKLVYWEAIRMFRSLNVLTYDFFGARINPAKGSKQEALGLFKKRFGAVLKVGYLWRYSFRPMKFSLYRLAAFLRSRGDIVDSERRRTRGLQTAGPEGT
jgi:hypothetical protein